MNIANFIVRNKALINAGANATKGLYQAGKFIKKASDLPEDYKKTDKELIEDMKTEKIYTDLLDLAEIKKLHTPKTIDKPKAKYSDIPITRETSVWKRI